MAEDDEPAGEDDPAEEDPEDPEDPEDVEEAAEETFSDASEDSLELLAIEEEPVFEAEAPDVTFEPDRAVGVAKTTVRLPVCVAKPLGKERSS